MTSSISVVKRCNLCNDIFVKKDSKMNLKDTKTAVAVFLAFAVVGGLFVAGVFAGGSWS